MSKEISEYMTDAIEHFQKRAEKTISLEKLLNSSNLLNKIDINDLEALEKRAKEYIRIAQARYDSGNLSEHELLFHKCFALETQVHEARWSNGKYKDVLDPISNKMREVERKHGLSENEYWPIYEAPEEYQELANEYDKVMEEKLLETFIEFGADDLENLYLNDPEKFNELHGIGYSSVFIKNEQGRLRVLATNYEKEAEVASNSGAFFAASVMLGSAIETRLIITCLENEKEVWEALGRLGLTKKILKSKNPLTWKLKTLIDVCCEAGWISDFDMGRFTYSGQAMLNFLRATRNNVHPGVKIKKGNGLVMGQEQFKDVKHIHTLLTSALNWPNQQTDQNEKG